MRKKFLFFVLGTISVFHAFANITLPGIFSNNMVLQRNQPIPVWGWAAPREKVSVSIAGKTKSAVTGKDGKWMIRLDAIPAGGPYTLTAKGKNTIVLENILIGEVWFCSGQSNMEMPVAGWGEIKNYQQEIADAKFPQIRQFDVEKSVSADPLDTVSGKWMECNPKNAGNFIATGYFFARDLYKKLNVPIGVINCSWGGSMIETWISRDAFENSDEFKTMINDMPADSISARLKRKNQAKERILAEFKGRTGQMTLPGFWEEQDPKLSELDGKVMFEKTITIKEDDAGKSATLVAGQADDVTEIFVNGKMLTEIYGDRHSCDVPSGLLKAGENVIGLRVADYGGTGGINKAGGDIYLKVDSTTIPLNGVWNFRIESVQGNSNPNSYPTLLYNAMVHPVIPYAIKGALWYQGETNAGRAYQYRKAFPLMIANWRAKWNQGDFPFYFVQLASFDSDGGNSEKGSTWAELREAQTSTLSVANTGMAITTDIGDSHDIHPKNKQDVGKRLAAIALKNTYGVQVAATGPVYASMAKDGDKIIISFSNADGLNSNDKYGYVRGFEIAGADKKFSWAQATIEGNKVILHSDKVKDPQAVHYSWADDAGESNLFNQAGLPAAPFRTDNWPGVTEKAVYAIDK